MEIFTAALYPFGANTKELIVPAAYKTAFPNRFPDEET
jgi:hypothetical protein